MAVPDAVKSSFSKVQASLKFKVYLKAINGKFYVYRQTSAWDRQNKRVRVHSTYIGRIKEDGTDIRKEETSDDELENAKAIIFKHGGKVVMPEEQRAMAEDLGFVSDTDRKLLTCLSMNARASRKFIGSIAGLSASAAHYRIKHLEERFGIRYIPEIDTMKLGFLTYLVFVKFYNEKPTLDEIKSSMENEPRVQFVGATSGDYDLIVLVLAENNEKATGFIYTIRTGEELGKYESRWVITPFQMSYGTFLLRDKFFEALKERVWTRSKDAQKPNKDSLTNREYSTLKELNEDGLSEFTKIDAKYSFDRGAAQYAYYKLRDRGLIKRNTITMRKTPLRYNAVVFTELINGLKLGKTQNNLLLEIVGSDPVEITNRYSIVGDVGVPNGVLFLFPVIKESALQDTEGRLTSELDGFKISSLIITNVVLGELCYRLYDNKYTIQYENLIKRKILHQEERKIYEE